MHYLKRLILGVSFCALNSMVVALQTTPESEAKARQNWLQKFNNSISLPNEKAIPLIADGIRRLGDQSIFHDQDAARPVYQEGQRILLSIPGHATYYRDKVKAAQVAVKEGRMRWADWSDVQIEASQTLQHMPSEETVEVLTGFLDDNFACADSDNPADYQIAGLEHLIREWDMSIREPAAKALDNLGIENPPAATDSHIDGGGPRRGWQQWWKEVKAGKRKYRFKGSSVEHPINAPPATVREVRRPGREVDAAPTTTTTEKPVPLSPKNEEAKGGSPQWPVFAGIAAILAALATYFLRRKGKGG